jgi:predicted transcriptional regulator
MLVPQARRSAGAVSEDALLSHVRTNPGQRGEEIAKAMGTEAATVRPVMKRLIEAGRVRAQGRARAMSYAAA